MVLHYENFHISNSFPFSLINTNIHTEKRYWTTLIWNTTDLQIYKHSMIYIIITIPFPALAGYGLSIKERTVFKAFRDSVGGIKWNVSHYTLPKASQLIKCLKSMVGFHLKNYAVPSIFADVVSIAFTITTTVFQVYNVLHGHFPYSTTF